MIEGIDVLFRIAFAILRTNEQELLHSASIPAVYVALESLPNRMWEADRLLQVRDRLRPSNSMFSTSLCSHLGGGRSSEHDYARGYREAARCSYRPVAGGYGVDI